MTRAGKAAGLALLLHLAFGCAAPAPPVYRAGLDAPRFTRVNFRPEGNVLRSANFLVLPSTIPLGTPATIALYSTSRVELVLGGTRHVLHPLPAGARFPTDDAGITAFIAKYFVDRKEDLDIDAMGPPELRDKVLGGTQMIGMTKEQVYACLGPPMFIDEAAVPALTLTRDQIIASDQWIYPNQLILMVPTTVTLFFGDGRLQKQVP